MGEIFHLFGGLDVRPSLRSMSDLSERGKPEIVLWARPRDMAPDGLFALVCGDISVPVTFPLGRFGWAPTVQLTTYLRTLPRMVGCACCVAPIRSGSIGLIPSTR